MRKDDHITIELLGSYTCLHVESGLLVDRGDRKNRNSPRARLDLYAVYSLTKVMTPKRKFTSCARRWTAMVTWLFSSGTVLSMPGQVWIASKPRTGRFMS